MAPRNARDGFRNDQRANAGIRGIRGGVDSSTDVARIERAPISATDFRSPGTAVWSVGVRLPATCLGSRHVVLASGRSKSWPRSRACARRCSLWGRDPKTRRNHPARESHVSQPTYGLRTPDIVLRARSPTGPSQILTSSNEGHDRPSNPPEPFDGRVQVRSSPLLANGDSGRCRRISRWS